mgnify:CR=1 FL=1
MFNGFVSYYLLLITRQRFLNFHFVLDVWKQLSKVSASRASWPSWLKFYYIHIEKVCVSFSKSSKWNLLYLILMKWRCSWCILFKTWPRSSYGMPMFEKHTYPCRNCFGLKSISTVFKSSKWCLMGCFISCDIVEWGYTHHNQW